MKIVINPKYEPLRPFIERLPQNFDHIGTTIYRDRNEIRQIEIEGLTLCVKRFRKPIFINRIIYTFFRKSKAQRAYDNAQKINTTIGHATPEPIAYILCQKFLAESYLITIKSPLTHTFYDFRDGDITGKEGLIRAFARFTANLHESGILHLDYSPGNILYDCKDGKWQFEIIDINRMRFGKVSIQKGCRNFCRLWGKNDFFELLALEYANSRQSNAEQTNKWILQARERYWQNRFHEHFVTENDFTVGIIVSTYNNPRWLELALWALVKQAHQANEIIVADDGSDDNTRKVVEQFANLLPIKHIWHEDNGFRKTTILNKAVVESQSDYLIFIDQDLIAREDFISQHYRHARKGHFISGGAIVMPEQLSDNICKENINYNQLFNIGWLKRHGMPWNWKMSKLWRNDRLCRILNRLTTAKASWNGGNASTWREYIIAAGGFDTRMKYGAEDREFGQRLENAGIKGIQLRYGTPLMHLYHTRPYRNEADWQRNKAIWKETIQTKRTTTDYGINTLR